MDINISSIWVYLLTFNFSIGQFLATTDVCERDQLINGVETVDELIKGLNLRDNILLLKNGSQVGRIGKNKYPYLIRLRLMTGHINEVAHHGATSLKTLRKAVLGELCSVTGLRETAPTFRLHQSIRQ